jgi:heat shock protein HspQ
MNPSRPTCARRATSHFYHLLAENEESSYVAYVSQQNLMADPDTGPVEHPSLDEMFDGYRNGRYRLRRSLSH